MRIYYAHLWYDTGIYLQEPYMRPQTRSNDRSTGLRTKKLTAMMISPSSPYNIIIDPATKTAATPRPAYGSCDDPTAAFPLAVAAVDEPV